MVVMTAVLCAAAVAFVADAVVPDDLYAEQAGLAQSLQWPDEGNDLADYSGGSVTVDPDAPDTWLLPLNPSDGWYISDKVRTRGSRLHYGWDFASYGAAAIPIRSVHAGVVVEVTYESGFGRNVKIHHGDGIVIIYAHQCCEGSSTIIVSEGQQVEAGQMIGRVGDTGNSFGAHLHLEIRRYDVDSAGRVMWRLTPDRVLDVDGFFRDRGVDLEKKQEQANGGMVG
jgi:murein DD-endopeptidase MepM/ murein hydrolase activator NlpD